VGNVSSFTKGTTKARLLWSSLTSSAVNFEAFLGLLQISTERSGRWLGGTFRMGFVSEMDLDGCDEMKLTPWEWGWLKNSEKKRIGFNW
jgi:hypothetical protein